MARASTWIVGAGTGAGLMYWFDPERGRRRRAIARDRLTHIVRVERELLGKALRDLEHRRQGAHHFARSLFRNEAASDAILVERVRAMLGRLSTHPRSIEVLVKDGVATLSGPILAREAERLLAEVAEVPGLQRVDERLDRHEQPGNVPGLQGNGLHVPRRRRLGSSDSWMPAVRLVLGGAGLVGVARRGPLGAALAAGGSLLALRALSNRPLAALVRQTHDERGERRLTKSLYIEAPVETVYSYFRNFENLARVMDHVDEVHVSNSRSSWKVRGPVGRPVGFEVELTRDQPNRLIAWQTVPNHGFTHHGVVRFAPEGSGTRLELELSYDLPGGALGRAVASWFGADPKRVLDEDLVRFKSVLEQGKTHAHQRVVTRDDLRPA